MAGEDNLKPVQSKEEARERGRLGGIASGKARREKKAMRDTLEALLAMSLKNGKQASVENIKSLAAMKGKNISVQEAVMFAQIQRALKGDVRAAEFIRDTIGQKPVDNMNVVGEVNNPMAGLTTEELKKLIEDG